MKEEEILMMRIELAETASLIENTIRSGIPMSRPALLYLIERVRVLRKELADAETDMMKYLYNQIQSN